MRFAESVETLAEAGVLTERQAEAFVLRDVEGVPREAAAESMDISPNVLDKYLRAARDKVDSAEATVEAVQDVRHEEIPSRCSECDSTLGGRFSKDDEGNALCVDCAGIETDDI